MKRYNSLLSLVVGVLLLGAGMNPARAEIPETAPDERIATEASVTAGYLGYSADDNAGNAREYDSLESSALFKARLFTDQGDYHLDLGIDYLNDDDYSAETHLDYRGLLQLDLQSLRYYHNVDAIPYDNGYSGGEAGTPLTRTPTGTPADGSRQDAIFPITPTPYYTTPEFTGDPAGTKNPAYRTYYTDQNPGEDYGLQLDMSEAKLKIKCPDFPAHITLSYWRYEKEGEKQLRFVDENCATACHMQSKTQKINRVTEEVKAGFDAHAGFVDIVLEALFRTFNDKEQVPVDDFNAHSNPGVRAAGSYEHDEAPDSKLSEFTVKLNTAPSGGLVGSAGFTLGKRENESDLNSVSPVDAETDYYRAAADATYTPSQKWTFNLRYRLLDLDSDNNSVIYDTAPTGAFTSTPLPVRSSMDITRAWYEAIASYRPMTHLTLKAEFRREDIERSNTSGSSPDWELPGTETISRVKLGFNSRFLEKSALKLNGWLAYRWDDDPAYGTSYSDSQELFLTASYSPEPLWGVMANVNLTQQNNNDHEVEDVPLGADRKQQNVSLGAWVTPREGLSFDLNYGFFHTAIDQDMLFGTTDGYMIKDDNVGYRQTVHSVTAGMTWQALKELSCRLEGYYARSKADWDPNFDAETVAYAQRSGPTIYYFPGEASSDDLDEISELDLRQAGVRARAEWQFDQNWACGVEATFDDFNDLGDDSNDGTVQTAMVSFSRRW